MAFFPARLRNFVVKLRPHGSLFFPLVDNLRRFWDILRRACKLIFCFGLPLWHHSWIWRWTWMIGLAVPGRFRQTAGLRGERRPHHYLDRELLRQRSASGINWRWGFTIKWHETLAYQRQSVAGRFTIHWRHDFSATLPRWRLLTAGVFIAVMEAIRQRRCL